MRECHYDIIDLLPHRPPAVLLDRVISWDDAGIETEVQIRPGIPYFVEGQGVPAHVGLEYMAQCCGAYSGLLSKENNLPIQLGFLLGTRNFHSTTAWFSPGVTLVIRAREVFSHDRMGYFSCRILWDGNEIASAELNVYQPDDPSVILSKSQRGQHE